MLVYLLMIDTPEDRSKFERLYKRYRGLMFKIANDILNNKRDSEDAVHQAFVKVAEHIENIDDSIEPRVRGFLVKVARNKAFDIYRRKKRRAKIEVPMSETVGLTVEYNGSNKLTACMAKLPENYQDVLLLKHLHGFSTKEIGKLLGLSTANVHKIHQRAKKRLKEMYFEENKQ